jgi:hypothetical protein
MDAGIGSCAEDLLMLLMFGYEVRGELVGKDVAVDCLCVKVECAAAQCTTAMHFQPNFRDGARSGSCASHRIASGISQPSFCV